MSATEPAPPCVTSNIHAMKNQYLKWLYSLLFLFFSLTLSGCDLIGDVLEFGFWTAIIIIGILVLIVYFVARMFRK